MLIYAEKSLFLQTWNMITVNSANSLKDASGGGPLQ